MKVSRKGGRSRRRKRPTKKESPPKRTRRGAHKTARATAATTVKIEYKSQGQGFKAWIDGAPISLRDGKGSLKVYDGVHYLMWAAWGPPAALVEVNIVAPEEAKDDGQPLPIGEDFRNVWVKKFRVGSS